jgi:hypothetical protein
LVGGMAEVTGSRKASRGAFAAALETAAEDSSAPRRPHWCVPAWAHMPAGAAAQRRGFGARQSTRPPAAARKRVQDAADPLGAERERAFVGCTAAGGIMGGPGRQAAGVPVPHGAL